MFRMNNRNTEENIIISAAAEIIAIVARRRRTFPSIRVNPYLQKRKTKGRFVKDFLDLVANPSLFKENFHMDPEIFQNLFTMVEHLLLPKRNSRPNESISPLEKFAIVIEYLASGTIQRHLASVYRISKQYFGRLIDEVCSAISQVLSTEIPTLNKIEFIRIANEFNAMWNLPNCLGAIDGKHVAIKCPKNAASLFYNYKGFHSIVLMAISDANYAFTYVDVGAYGSEGDANVFSATELGRNILEDNMEFPEDMEVGPDKLPYFFVADDAFPLKKRILKPFAPRKPKKLENDERIANYRISRARRCVENAFGILCSKWICLGRTMFCNPDKAQKIVTACCYLHNFLLRTSNASYCPPQYADYYDSTGCLIRGEWRKNVAESALCNCILPSNAGRQSNDGKCTRNKIKEFVNSPIGSIPWQQKAAFFE